MKTSVVMSEVLRNDSKNVYVSLSGILKKTINFYETLPQESEFLSKCRHYWRINFGLFFMSARVLAVFKFAILQQPQIWA